VSPIDINKLLNNTNLGAEIQKRQLQWRKEALVSGGSREQVFWARKAISSRCFPARPGHPFPMMIPVVDSLNHSINAKPYWSWTDTHFVFGTDDYVQPGDEVFGNYGPKSNEELLLGYGFALPNNPNNYVSVRISGRTFQLRERNPELPQELLDMLHDNDTLHDMLCAIALPNPQRLLNMTTLQNDLFEYATNQRIILQTYQVLTSQLARVGPPRPP